MTWVPGRFPPQHFGKLYGLAMALSALVALLQYPCVALVQGPLQGDPFYVSVPFHVSGSPEGEVGGLLHRAAPLPNGSPTLGEEGFCHMGKWGSHPMGKGGSWSCPWENGCPAPWGNGNATPGGLESFPRE